jgi:AcrR family transcriptional regulator
MTDTQATIEADRKLLPNLDESEKYPENARRMMRAAVRLFARQGYAGTSVREIVQAADVTNPMLYYYFDNKEGLFRTLITFLFDVVAIEIGEALEEAEDFEAAIEAVITSYFEACLRSPIALQFVYTVLFGPKESTPSFDVFSARAELAERIAGAIQTATDRGEFEPQPGFDTEFVTELLLGVINNHLMRALKLAEQCQGHEQRMAVMEETLDDQSAQQIKQFFLSGAGHVTGGEHS